MFFLRRGEQAERPEPEAHNLNKTPLGGLSFGGLWCNWQHD